MLIFFKDSWLYHLTVVSGSGSQSGSQFEQLIQKLMEASGDPSRFKLYIYIYIMITNF